MVTVERRDNANRMEDTMTFPLHLHLCDRDRRTIWNDPGIVSGQW